MTPTICAVLAKGRGVGVKSNFSPSKLSIGDSSYWRLKLRMANSRSHFNENSSGRLRPTQPRAHPGCNAAPRDQSRHFIPSQFSHNASMAFTLAMSGRCSFPANWPIRSRGGKGRGALSPRPLLLERRLAFTPANSLPLFCQGGSWKEK